MSYIAKTKSNIKKSNMVIRDGLLQIFDSFDGERIIYVHAPAGYGKTVAVKQWLEYSGLKYAAVCLDEYDNNFTHFCERFCAAMGVLQPDNISLAEIYSHPSFYSAPDEFTLRSVVAMDVSQGAVLVIDDLHFIEDKRVLGLLSALLKRLPEGIQTVLISRHNLPAEFADLWIKGGIASILPEQMRFSGNEIAQLYKKRGEFISLSDAEEICQQTGGWAIGINALLLSGNKFSAQGLGYLDEFIRVNVWEKWDKTTREFMINTAAARELEPSLCDILTKTTNSAETLAELASNGAFIFQTSVGTYHYHQIFHEFLKDMLSQRGCEYIYELLEKEGRWYLSRKDFYCAADCFVRCNNSEGIADCMEILESDRRREFVVELLLSLINQPIFVSVAEKHPHLYSVMAWAAFAAGNSANMKSFADLFYSRQREITENDPAHSHYFFLMCFIDFRIPLRTIKGTPTNIGSFDGNIVKRGSLAMNMPLLHRGTRDFSELADSNTEGNVAEMVNMAGWLFGEEATLLSKCLTAGLLYEQGKLERAHVYAAGAAAEIQRHYSPESKFCALSILVCVLDAAGHSEEANNTIELIRTMIEQDRAYCLTANFKALSARRKFERCDTMEARSWIEKNAPGFDAPIALYESYRTFTTCRAYMVNANYDLAIMLLNKSLEKAIEFNRPLDCIEANILLSIAYRKKKRGFTEVSIRYLEEAVALAHCYGFTQIFVNDATELVGALQRMIKKAEQGNIKIPIAFIKNLHLRTLENSNLMMLKGEPEKFTEKQKAVMQLLCEGKSYKEITEQLGIKLPTLRSHISLIYKKLDVTNKTDAIMRIKTTNALGF